MPPVNLRIDHAQYGGDGFGAQVPVEVYEAGYSTHQPITQRLRVCEPMQQERRESRGGKVGKVAQTPQFLSK